MQRYVQRYSLICKCRLGLISHCGVGRDMNIMNVAVAGGEDPSLRNDTVAGEANPFTKELMCAMRIHLLSENETHIFCPANAKVKNCNI